MFTSITVNVLYYRDQESIYEAFTRGEASYAPLLSTQAQRLYAEGSEYLIQKELEGSARVLFMNNQVSYSDDKNAALSNVNFRRSLFYGIDQMCIRDRYTVQYTMSKSVPYFTSVCCYAAFYPANRQFVESMSCLLYTSRCV